jgi:hypothetical protein
VIKLLLASIAVVSSWLWMRDFFSRAIDGREKPTSRNFALRGIAFAVSLVWFVSAVLGVIGGLVGWLVIAVIVGILVKVLARGLPQSPAADRDPPAESK